MGSIIAAAVLASAKSTFCAGCEATRNGRSGRSIILANQRERCGDVAPDGVYRLNPVLAQQGALLALEHFAPSDQSFLNGD